MHTKSLSSCSVVQLSAECLDLLNHIMVPSEEERYSIAQIKSHPWYNKPLSPKFAQAEKEIQQEQAAIVKRDSQRHVNIVRYIPVIHLALQHDTVLVLTLTLYIFTSLHTNGPTLPHRSYKPNSPCPASPLPAPPLVECYQIGAPGC